MLCTGGCCERRNECTRYYMNAPADGQIHTLENLYSFGSCSIRSDGTSNNHYWCGFLGNWGMFVPIEKTNLSCTNADHIRSMTDEELGLFLGEWAERHLCCMCDGTGETLHWLKQPYKEDA